MDTVAKGNELEADFFEFLKGQQDRGELVYGVHENSLCELFRKKKYFCPERQADVEFDIVIEITAKGRQKPHYTLIFECKNYSGAVPESELTDFSDKLKRIFGHSAKGVLLFSSRLQSGTENLATSRGIGLAKFDKNGLEIQADRQARAFFDKTQLQGQFFEHQGDFRPLKFSALLDGKFLNSIKQLLDDDAEAQFNCEGGSQIRFWTDEELDVKAEELRTAVGHTGGIVDLAKVCQQIGVELIFSEREVNVESGEAILGSANFDGKRIDINHHSNKHRERFTIAHEIGHFVLGHGAVLRSEAVLAQDLFERPTSNLGTDIARLELQANYFASKLLMPRAEFKVTTLALCQTLGFQDRGHGLVFVDDQPCNYAPYQRLLAGLQAHFEVSKQVIEIRLERLGLLNDQRRSWERE